MRLGGATDEQIAHAGGGPLAAARAARVKNPLPYLLACALVWLGHHRKIRPPGLFALYVAGYSFARIGEELLRVDPAKHILGLRLNLYVASILCLAGLAWFARIQRERPARR